MVTIETGEHHVTLSESALSQTKQIIEKRIQAAGLSPQANWRARLGKAIRARGPTPAFRLVGLSKKGTVIVRVKPRGNDTCREFFLIPPNGCTPAEVHQALEALAAREAQAGVTEDEGEEPGPRGKKEEKVNLSGFSRDPVQVTRFLLELSRLEDLVPVETARTKLGELTGVKSGHSLGKVLSGLASQGLLEALREGTTAGITHYRLADKARQLLELRTSPVYQTGAGLDQVVPSLREELSRVEAEIASTQSSIAELQQKLEGLLERQRKVTTALEALEPLTPR